MKKYMIILIGLILSIPGYAIVVTPSSGPYYVGQNINFYASGGCFSYYTGTLYFGDGNSATGIRDTPAYSANHSYSAPGIYNVTLVSSYPTMCTTETFQITIEQSKYITFTPNPPHAGETVTFTANNFNGPYSQTVWDFGDGTVISSKGMRGRRNAGIVVDHVYTSEGSYVVKAWDGGDTGSPPVQKRITVLPAIRVIQYSPQSPIEDQKVFFTAAGFTTQQIDWNFGDGTILTASSRSQTHRFKTQGTYTVSAKDSTVNHTPVTTNITVLPDNRFIEASAPEVRTNEPVVFNAYNFVGELILWDFGDGTIISAGAQVEHVYERGGNYRVRAVDENGESEKVFETNISVLGVTDDVNLEVAEIRFDNGKYYKVVARNSKNIRAFLRMKLRGTGIITGVWLLDGAPFEFINEVAVQGEVKEIYTKEVPGLPTIDSGIHTVSLQLTKPSANLTFPELKYYVLPYENQVEIISPPDGFVAKEKEVPLFRWREPQGGVKYQIAFENYMYKFLFGKDKIIWIDTNLKREFKPGKSLWNGIKRNQWTFWKVRAMDSNGKVLAESDINEIKVVIATAEVSINSVETLDGKKLKISGTGLSTTEDVVIFKGSVKYKGHSKFIVLRVYLDDQMTDQLLFRNVKKGEVRNFETSIPNNGKGKVVFRVLKTSSPSVVIGIRGFNLKHNK